VQRPRPTRKRGVGLLLLEPEPQRSGFPAKFRPFDRGRTDGAAVPVNCLSIRAWIANSFLVISGRKNRKERASPAAPSRKIRPEAFIFRRSGGVRSPASEPPASPPPLSYTTVLEYGFFRHPRTIFRRALEHDNLVLAEVTAREIGRVTIAEALGLTALAARKQPERYGRFAARWLCLYLEERSNATTRRCSAHRLEAAIARKS
jgi:hypothetical protein